MLFVPFATAYEEITFVSYFVLFHLRQQVVEIGLYLLLIYRLHFEHRWLRCHSRLSHPRTTQNCATRPHKLKHDWLPEMDLAVPLSVTGLTLLLCILLIVAVEGGSRGG